MLENDDRDEGTHDGGGYASGFVVKLYQMVKEAPDDVISWTAAGDAFRISDLDRLENETLPAFFRHQRFQSLVRQLNFYNFRKINRERTFWIYRHPLFHRDRPECLHLLRRRTCPGVDGRRSRHESDKFETEDFGSDSDTLDSTEPVTKKHKLALRSTRPNKPNSGNQLTSPIEDRILDGAHKMSENASSFIVSESESPGDESPGVHNQNNYFPRAHGHQTNLLSKLSRKLEKHMKRASLAASSHRLSRRGGNRQIGVVTPPNSYHSDTMKFNALTYDDDEDWFTAYDDSVEDQRVRTLGHGNDIQQSFQDQAEAVSVDSSDCSSSLSDDSSDVVVRIIDKDTEARIKEKIRVWIQQGTFPTNVDGELLYSVLCFCLSTTPVDPFISDKAVTHLKLHAALFYEFQRYKAALLGNDFSLLDVKLLPDHLFGGNSESMDTTRIFKVFLVNYLRNITRDSNLCNVVNFSQHETYLFHASIKMWVEGVLSSA